MIEYSVPAPDATELEKLRYETLQNFNTIDVSPRLDSYQRVDVFAGFDMPDVVARLHDVFDLPEGQELYLVVFRSQRKDGLSAEDIGLLTDYDHNAHEEAASKKDEYGRTSLLHYFKGLPDADGFCMSWCVWTSEATAKLASGKEPKSEEPQGAEHHKAMHLARLMYQKYGIQTYRIRLEGESIAAQITQDTWTIHKPLSDQQHELALSEAASSRRDTTLLRAIGSTSI